MQTSGRLFYLIGPSGAGKDSLISYARRRVQEEGSIIFAHRYITRPPQATGENHVALSEKEFSTRLAKGFFALHWQSHGCRYGIGIEINYWLAEDCDVVVNGSRAYLPRARNLYPQLKVLLIAVSDAELERRLQMRGRETEEMIQSRLASNRRLETGLLHGDIPVTVIPNDGLLEKAGELLVKALA